MSLKSKDILIIDDDPEARVVPRKILENLGITVIEASSVEEAFQRLENVSPHLMLVDLHMPGTDGFDFLEKRSLNPKLSSIPVIVASALRDKKSVFRAISLGAADYVVKPFVAPTLIQKIRRQLKDLDFHSVMFEPGKGPGAVVSVSVELNQFSETTLMLGSPVRLAPDTSIDLQCESLKELGLGSVVYRTETQMGSRGVDGRYYSRVKLLGLPETLTKLIRAGGGRRSGSGQGKKDGS